MADYGSNEFSTQERIDHTLKLSLGKIQTKVENVYAIEPDVVQRQSVSQIYSKSIPKFNGEVAEYIVVDTMSGEANATARIVVDSGNNPLRVKDLINTYSTYTLNQIGSSSSYILNTSNIRKNEVAVNVTSDLVNVTVNGVALQAFNKPSRNMFGRYVYWKKGMTGKASYNSNYQENSGDPYIQNTSDGQGTYNSSQDIDYNETNNANEPFNGYVTLEGSGLSSERTFTQIQIATRAVENGNPSATQQNIYNFYQMLTSVYSGIAIVKEDQISSTNLTPVLNPILKCFMGMSTFTTYNGENEATTDQDSIVFLNPIAQQSFGESDGYTNDLKGYIISSYNGSTNAYQKRTVNDPSSFPGGSLIYMQTSGALILYSNDEFVTGDILSVTNPAFLSYVRYVGEKLSDGIITQGPLSSRPIADISNDKDLYVDTTNNILYRLENSGGTKSWIQIGASSNITANLTSYWREIGGTDIYREENIEYGNATSHTDGNITVHSQFRNYQAFFGLNYNNVTIEDTQLQAISGNSSVIVNGMLASRQITVTDYIDSLSDARLKTNIQPLENSLSAVRCIQPVTYDWKNKNVSREIGFIAQNVQTVFPQLVHNVNHIASSQLQTKGASGQSGASSQINQKYLTVNYIGFIPILCGALKEQQEQIDELKETIQELKDKLGK